MNLPNTFPKYSIIETDILHFFDQAIKEDIGSGDPSANACFSTTDTASAQLISKDVGIIAGIEVAKFILQKYSTVQSTWQVEDGNHVQQKQVLANFSGPAREILSLERLILNIMQRMSGIASLTHQFVQHIKHTNTLLLDTRKTTPNFRYFEKWATKIGGGENHRFALYDMIMLKDNHIDFCGGISNAIKRVNQYQKDSGTKLNIEVETRTFDEISECLSIDEIDRIMLDNFSPEMCLKAVELIQNKKEIEISGGITIQNISQYANTGVHYISTGATIHSAPNFDISLISKL